MMLNPPTFVEHNNDYAMNGTILGCSPPKSSNQMLPLCFLLVELGPLTLLSYVTSKMQLEFFAT